VEAELSIFRVDLADCLRSFLQRSLVPVAPNEPLKS
jgi:hypothetical protein